jgi:hypothetical protein
MWKNLWYMKFSDVTRKLVTCLPILLALVSLSSFVSPAHAQGGVEVFCDGNQFLWKDNGIEFPKIELPKLVQGIVVTAVTEIPTYLATGKNSDNAAKCGVQQMRERGILVNDHPSCSLSDTTICDDMKVSGIVFNGDPNLVNSGILSVVNSVEGAIMQDPIPVNMAYFLNRKVEGVPFFGRTLAAVTLNNPEYGGPFLGLIYDLWAFVRNIAFGLMAVIMMVLGIMIIMKKQVGPQASVTVQMALPRVVIAMILITFSYVIGAAGASLAYNLRGSVPLNLTGGTSITQTPENNTWGTAGVISGMEVASMAYMGAGVVLTGIVAILSLLLLVLLLIVIIKMLSVYLKILFSVMTAPLIFAIGAIPGQDETTVNWFKTFAAHVISIPAMWFIVSVTNEIAWKMINDALTVPVTQSSLGGFGAGLFGILIIPIVLFFGWNFARTVPDKIETAIVGEKKRR